MRNNIEMPLFCLGFCVSSVVHNLDRFFFHVNLNWDFGGYKISPIGETNKYLLIKTALIKKTKLREKTWENITKELLNYFPFETICFLFIFYGPVMFQSLLLFIVIHRPAVLALTGGLLEMQFLNLGLLN